MKIFGAGLAGLIAACHWQDAEVLEAAPSPAEQPQHKALLRFRSPAVGDAVGLEFRKVRVHKGVWFDGRFVQPDIRLCNWYSHKVSGRTLDRSIWHTESVYRWVAPHNFHEMLVDRCNKRIKWGVRVDTDTLLRECGDPVVSTLPMPVLARMLGEEDMPTFSSNKICVRRWKVLDADVFQTVYFPSLEHSLYRASITGDILTAEYVDEFCDTEEQFDAFGLDAHRCVPIGGARQQFGKIAPIDEGWRKRFVLRASMKHGVYSLGRFATWRNILLDDALHDIGVIRKLIGSSAYDHARVGC